MSELDTNDRMIRITPRSRHVPADPPVHETQPEAVPYGGQRAGDGGSRRCGVQQRMDIGRVAPEAYRAVAGLEGYVQKNVDHTVLELVKLRASMINGCAFCVDMHSRDALAAGESSRRLFAVSAWRESSLFDERERAALALTDEVTRLGEHGVSDEVWDGAAKVWSEKELADLVVAIATINVWNRVAVTVHAQTPTEV
ncbi:carboxymuconolactone decarboxylase family protein [Micromonospora sp. NPDC004704]